MLVGALDAGKYPKRRVLEPNQLLNTNCIRLLLRSSWCGRAPQQPSILPAASDGQQTSRHFLLAADVGPV